MPQRKLSIVGLSAQAAADLHKDTSASSDAFGVAVDSGCLAVPVLHSVPADSHREHLLLAEAAGGSLVVTGGTAGTHTVLHKPMMPSAVTAMCIVMISCPQPPKPIARCQSVPQFCLIASKSKNCRQI